jgi:hypothetical protein
MNTELAFRLGFCEKLAASGVSPAEVGDALDALAAKSASNAAKEFLTFAGKGGKKVFETLGAAGFFGPAILAGIAGHLSAKSKTVSPMDIEYKKKLMVVRELEDQRQYLEDRRQGIRT